MRKRIKGRKFGRKAGQRKALLRHLAEALILRGKIATTEARAKELRMFVEPIVTKSKKNSLAARRSVARVVSPRALKRLFEEIEPKVRERNGGYLRIIKLGQRTSDAAPMARIEFVD